jgi:hypothetical protein
MIYFNLFEILNIELFSNSFLVALGFYLFGNYIIDRINKKRLAAVKTPLEEPETQEARIQLLNFISDNYVGEDIVTKMKKLTPEDIDDIINNEENSKIKKRSYIIAYTYLDLLIFPENKVIRKLQKITKQYSNKHIIFKHLSENIFEIFIKVENILPNSVYKELPNFKFMAVLFMALASFVLLGLIY